VIVIVAGVAGSGKTTVGAVLAGGLGWPVADADEQRRLRREMVLRALI